MAGSLLDNETHATTNPRLYVKREAISSIHNRVVLTLPDAADILYGNNEYGSRRVDPGLFDSQYQGPHPQPVLSADSCHLGSARLYPSLPGDCARVPKRPGRFSRYNIYARDKLICQYCGRRLPRYELNLDHVIPRSRGGTSTWENVVCSCHECNRRKGGRTPHEAGMALLHRPYKPKWTPFMQETFNLSRYREWHPFLNAVDVSYWNTELLE